MLSRRNMGVAAVMSLAALPGLSQGESRPAGVSKEQWVKLGDSAGILITSRPPQSSGKTPGEAKGELWIKLGGSWSPAVLEQPRQVVPAL